MPLQSGVEDVGSGRVGLAGDLDRVLKPGLGVALDMDAIEKYRIR